MSAPALGEQRFWVSGIDAALGSQLRIRINAAEVSLVLQPPINSSIRNVLLAKVSECMEVNGQVEVKLALGEHVLWACDELAIYPGKWLYAPVKSGAISRELR